MSTRITGPSFSIYGPIWCRGTYRPWHSPPTNIRQFCQSPPVRTQNCKTREADEHVGEEGWARLAERNVSRRVARCVSAELDADADAR